MQYSVTQISCLKRIIFVCYDVEIFCMFTLRRFHWIKSVIQWKCRTVIMKKYSRTRHVKDYLSYNLGIFEITTYRRRTEIACTTYACKFKVFWDVQCNTQSRDLRRLNMPGLADGLRIRLEVVKSLLDTRTMDFG